MVIYIIHFEVQKNKTAIVLGVLSIDLIQKEGVNSNYSSWKINCGAISYGINLAHFSIQARLQLQIIFL